MESGDVGRPREESCVLFNNLLTLKRAQVKDRVRRFALGYQKLMLFIFCSFEMVGFIFIYFFLTFLLQISQTSSGT